MSANKAMTFYGQEKVDYNAKLCLMNIAVHGLTGVIKSGEEANSFYNDAHNLVGCCDYVMANPPFNVDKVKAEAAQNAGRLPFGLPSVNKAGEIGNANYLWISYFYAYLNEKGRAGFVMAASATDSQGKDRDIRERLTNTGHVDAIINVGQNFFYTKSLPCTLWFFNKGKQELLKDKVLFIDARNYYTVVDRTLNEWSEWQLKNLNAIVWLYRGESEKYTALIEEYHVILGSEPFNKTIDQLSTSIENLSVEAKKQIEYAPQKEKKKIRTRYEEQIASIEEKLTIAKNANWLFEKFGNGEYRDISGLCRIATSEEISEMSYSFNPSDYVGAQAVTFDGIDYKKRMTFLMDQLSQNENEAREITQSLLNALGGLGL